MAQTGELTTALLPTFPDLGPADRRLVGPLFVLLGQGRPVSPEALARAVGMPAADVRRRLAAWWGIRYDGDGLIIGFLGLDLFATRHQLRVGQRDVFAWSAWDALCLPALLGEEAAVASLCPATGDDVRLAVAPAGVLDAEPEDARLALEVPGPAGGGTGFRQAFCRDVRFLADREAAAEWQRAHPAVQILSLEQGHRLGQRVWRALLGMVEG